MKINVAEVFNRGMLAYIHAYVDSEATEVVNYQEEVQRFDGCETCGGDDTVNLVISYTTPKAAGRWEYWPATFRYDGSLAEFIRAMDEVDV